MGVTLVAIERNCVQESALRLLAAIMAEGIFSCCFKLFVVVFLAPYNYYIHIHEGDAGKGCF